MRQDSEKTRWKTYLKGKRAMLLDPGKSMTSMPFIDHMMSITFFSYYLNEEYSVGGISGSAAIPIANPSSYGRPGGAGLISMMNLSGDSNESAADSVPSSSSYPSAPHQFTTKLDNITHQSQEKMMSHATIKLFDRSQEQKGPGSVQEGSIPMGYETYRAIPVNNTNVASYPHDPYPSPVLPHLSLHLQQQHHQIRTQRSIDHLSMVYGQSCPEPGYASSSIPGMKQMRFPMEASPLNVIFPHHLSNGRAQDYLPPSNHALSTASNAAELNGSLFQFRTTNPASADQIIEKQKKRKESHNAVERRRRDHINEMIQQLGALVEDANGSEAGRLNKGEILQRAVEKIRLLERTVRLQKNRLAAVDPSFQLDEASFTRERDH